MMSKCHIHKVGIASKRTAEWVIPKPVPPEDFQECALFLTKPTPVTRMKVWVGQLGLKHITPRKLFQSFRRGRILMTCVSIARVKKYELHLFDTFSLFSVSVWTLVRVSLSAEGWVFFKGTTGYVHHLHIIYEQLLQHLSDRSLYSRLGL